MGTFLEELAAKYHLDEDSSQAWGLFEEYWVQIIPNSKSGSMIITTAVQFADDQVQAAVNSSLSALAQATPSTSFSIHDNAISVERKLPFGGLKLADVEPMLQSLVDCLRKAGAKPACFSCGAEGLHGFAKVNGMAMMLCQSCQQQISGHIMQGEAEHAETKGNYLAGAFGALLGALVGSIAWIVIGLLGFFAAIGGVAISFCAAKGYTMMKGKINIAAIIMICLICIVVLVFAQFVEYGILVMQEASKTGESITFMESMQMVYFAALNVPEVTSEFVINLGLGLLFLALGAYSVIRQLFVSAKAPAGTFQRL